MLQEKELEELLAFCHRTVDKSGKLLLDYLERGFGMKIKPDKSEVTEADTAAEELIRREIAANFPGHSIVGEELGGELGSAEFQWIIDPIDGTANFLTGIPTYGTILALFHKNAPVVAVTDHPSLGRRYHSRKGGGVFCGSKRLSVRGLSRGSLSPQESVAISGRPFFEYSGEGWRFDRFAKEHPNIRIYRDVFAHGLTAGGNLGGMVEWNNMIWDVAAARLFTEEAGGVYFETPSIGEAAKLKRLNVIFGSKETVGLLKPFFLDDAARG